MPANDARKSHLFFDISSLIDYVSTLPRYSGIQRVVTSVLAELLALPDAERCYLSFIDGGSGKVSCLPLTDLTAEILLDPVKMRAFFFPNSTLPQKIKALDRYSDSRAKYLFHRTRLDLSMLAGRERAFIRYDLSLEQWRKLRFSKPIADELKRSSNPRPFESVAKPGDHLLLLDSSWRDLHLQGFRKLHESGLRITTLVYDLIPVNLLGTTDQGMALMFHNWLLGSTDYTDSYLAISHSARDDLVRFLTAYDKTQSCDVLSLTQCGLSNPGTETREPGPMEAKIDPKHYADLLESVQFSNEISMLANSPFVLCVGTIEVRKNGWRLALAWKHLIEQGRLDMPRLIFAGRKGWLSDQLFDLLKGTGNLYGYVTVLDGPSDDELSYLYRKCLFTAMPSLYEGWGLPVGEALSYGKTSVISNTSSLPEVGQDLVEYCDPMSVASISAAVLRLVDHPERRKELERKIAGADLRDWSDVAQDLLRIAG